MSPVTRKATPVAAVAFGALSNYSGGFTLPEGDYALEFDVQMFAGTKQDGSKAGPERLGVMVTAHPLAGGEPTQQFYSMGGKAHLSFAPNPETGKGLVLVPGGAGGSLNNQTNWVLLLKSLYDCGLPEGVFSDDFSTLDGIHVHTAVVPEPESRKGFGAKTGEAEQEERKPGLVAVVTEIKEDGKPWEGSGGIPGAEAPAPVKAGPKAVAKVAPKVAPKAAPAPVEEEVSDEDAVHVAAISGMTSVLEKNPTGCTKIKLRTDTFKAVEEDQRQAVIETYFNKGDDVLNQILGELGYNIVGAMVKAIA